MAQPFTIGAPDMTVYVGMPTPMRQEESTIDVPTWSSGPRQMFSVPAGHPDTMLDQPAFAIFAPVSNSRSLPGYDCEAMNEFQYGGQRNGFPTFFPIGNRAAISNMGDQGGRIESNKLLLTPPTRYNEAYRRSALVPRNVRDTGSTYSKGVRSRIPALSLGG